MKTFKKYITNLIIEEIKNYFQESASHDSSDKFNKELMKYLKDLGWRIEDYNKNGVAKIFSPPPSEYSNVLHKGAKQLSATKVIKRQIANEYCMNLNDFEMAMKNNDLSIKNKLIGKNNCDSTEKQDSSRTLRIAQAIANAKKMETMPGKKMSSQKDIENIKNFITKMIKEELEETKKYKIFVLVGPPSVGKTTWINNTFKDEKPFIVNRDDIVEEVASKHNWTYDDLFVGPPKESKLGDINEKYGEVVNSPSWMSWQPLSFSKVLEANNEIQKIFINKVGQASKHEGNIVVDMTNMNSKIRKQALDIISNREEEFQKIAVVFNFKGSEELIMRVAEKRAEIARQMGKSKTISKDVYKRMFDSFQDVSSDEGFDEIISVDNAAAFKKLLDKDNEKI